MTCIVMDDASSQAADALKDQGLRVVPETLTSKMPKLPPDITSLMDENLMDLFVKLTSWVDYLAVQVACAQIDERDAQKQLDFAEAQATVDGWSSQGSSRDARVAIAKAQRAVSPQVTALRDTLDEKHAYRKLIEVLATNLERDAALVSRELTRRTSSTAPATRRGSRLV